MSALQCVSVEKSRTDMSALQCISVEKSRTDMSGLQCLSVEKSRTVNVCAAMPLSLNDACRIDTND